MIYREFERLGQKTSLLGFGAMRFATTGTGEVDEAETIRLIRHAIDRGINYLDTAYTYHGGQSETILGKALKDGYREKVLLADKLPVWLVKEEADVRRFFEEELQRLDMDYIDLYLVHNLTKDNWEITKRCNVMPILEELRAEGRIGKIGFSYHDDLPLFKEIIDAYPWDFCQIQLNYVDAGFQAGLEGLRYAGARGIPVVIMEPLKGGRLTDAVPPAIQEIWDDAPVRRTPAEWAFKWVASQPEVACVLSGMGSMEQLEQNLAIFSSDDMTVLTETEKEAIHKAADLYHKFILYPCTECRYCMPCPSGVDIPRVIRYYNDWMAYEQNPKLKHEYLNWLNSAQHASNCVKCGACEAHCPQHLPIMEIMEKAAAAFGC